MNARQTRPRVAIVGGRSASLTAVEAAEGAARAGTDIVFVLDQQEVREDPRTLLVADSLATTVTADFGDYDSCREAIARLDATAVTTFVDQRCAIVEQLSQDLFQGPGVIPGRWQKDTQRALLAQAGLSSVSHARLRDGEALDAFAARAGFPIVIKPVNGVASKDTWLLATSADLSLFRDEVANDGRRLEEFTAERFAGGHGRAGSPYLGDYVSVELFAAPAGYEAFVTGRPRLAWPCRETGIWAPAHLSQAATARLIETAMRAHRALRLGNGAFHIEMKIAGPEVIEVNGRLGGYVRRLVKYGTGFDVGAAALAASAGVLMPLELSWNRHVAALLLQAPPEAQLLARAPSRRELASLPGVIAVDHVGSAGDRLDWRDGTAAAVAKIWLDGSDHLQLSQRFAEVAQQAHDWCTFIGEDGKRVADTGWLPMITPTLAERKAWHE